MVSKMINKIYKDTEYKMDKCLEIFKKHISKIHTGRASPNLLAGIYIDYYGSTVPLHQLANLVTEDAQTIAVTLFDRSLLPVVNKAIMSSNLGVNPFLSETVIRIKFPLLTEERRLHLVKVVRVAAEHGRVSIRNVRRDANEKIKLLLKDKLIREDDEHSAEIKIQKLTAVCIKNLDNILTLKEQELIKIK